MSGSAHLASAAHLLLSPTPKAIVFDVDGTLYDQRPLRRAMAARLIRHATRAPLRNWRTILVLRAYRAIHEQLRHSGPGTADLATVQIERVARHTGVNTEVVREIVRQWMEVEPLPLLATYARPGMASFVGMARARGIRLGVLSDYPCDDKLHALGLGGFMDVVLCAQDPAVQRLKPDPRGLLMAFARLGVEAADALYIGDRPDVDAVAAERAGARCVIVSSRRRSAAPSSAFVDDFSHLAAMLFGTTDSPLHSTTGE
jgi:FMN phosphatase YigB (HAD superfamily)